MKPSLRQMLQVAKGAGLTTIQEAYDYYTLHYDMFFLISEYSQQMAAFTAEIKSHNLTELRDGLCWMKDMSIVDAMKQLGMHKEFF